MYEEIKFYSRRNNDLYTEQKHTKLLHRKTIFFKYKMKQYKTDKDINKRFAEYSNVKMLTLNQHLFNLVYLPPTH